MVCVVGAKLMPRVNSLTLYAKYYCSLPFTEGGSKPNGWLHAHP